VQLSDYVAYDALGLAELVRSGEVRPRELADTALAAAAAVNPAIDAVIELWPDDIPAAIAAVPAGSPFAGVPFLIKDLVISAAGRRSEMGSRLAAGLVSPADSFLMQRFRAAGLVTAGRTTTPELGFSCTTESLLTGPTRNPWDLGRSAGGSSGGAAASVAAGIVPMAHASDGGGSIRIPAACCGLFGLKPTRGRVSVGPDAEEGLSGFGCELAVSRTVRDSAALLDAVQGAMVGDPYVIAPPAEAYLSEVTREPGVLRIGVLTHGLGGAPTEPAIAAALEAAARDCAALGHRVEVAEIDLGISWDAFMLANARIWNANLAVWIASIAGALGRPIDLSTLEGPTLACYEYGRAVSATDFLTALALRNIVSRTIGAWFASHDILMSPTLPGKPAPLGWFGQDVEGIDGLGWTEKLFAYSPFTPIFNVTGLPAMSMPLAAHEGSDLPIGIQFAAGFGREDVLFRLAGQLERAMPWGNRIPPVWAGNSVGSV
jgi:amidase